MTDEPVPAARLPRAVAGRTPRGRRRHAAAATRLVVGGAALAGTFNLAAVMAAAPTGSVEAPAPTPAPPESPTTTVPAPPTAPRTVVVVRRHVITGTGASAPRQTASPLVRSTPTPAPTPAPAPVAAPAPTPNTQTKGS